MRVLIITAIFSILTQGTIAQITLDYSNDSITFGGEFYCADIGNNDYKYVLLHFKTNSFSLYNMDMSPFITNILIPTTDSLLHGYTVIYVTKSLFDCDSTNVEYVYENPYGGNNDPFRIYRTDGTLLFQLDSAVGPFADGFFGGSLVIRPILNTSDGAKLLISKYNAQWFSGIQVYSLCGELPTSYLDISGEKSYLRVFPNPADMMINFEVALPNNQEEFFISILDNSGRELKRISITSMDRLHSIDVKDLSSGTYTYSLVSKSKMYQSGKFVLTK